MALMIPGRPWRKKPRSSKAVAGLRFAGFQDDNLILRVGLMDSVVSFPYENTWSFALGPLNISLSLGPFELVQYVAVAYVMHSEALDA